MPTGIELILTDHEVVNDLFVRFEKTGDATIVGQIVDALVAHDEAEQAALYPLAAVVLRKSKLLAHFEEAHSTVKKLIEHLSGLEGRPLLDAVAELRAAVTEHVEEEESELLPALDKAASAAQLDELAARIDHVKQRAG